MTIKIYKPTAWLSPLKEAGTLMGISSAVSAKSWHVSFGLRRPQKGSLVRFLVECV